MRALQKTVLRVDSHPVVTRFWTFAECVRTVLLILLLQLPFSRVFRVSRSIQQEQQLRLERVRAYMERREAAADLRIASLCLALTHLTTSLVSKQKKKEPGGSGSLIALAKGEVQHRAGMMATKQLQHLNHDPDLPKERACTALLVTLGHIIIRFQVTLLKQCHFRGLTPELRS